MDVNIELIFNKNELKKYKCGNLIKKLKLKSSLSLSNMNLFDNKEKLNHCDSVKRY